jgi:hypothetical protein
MRGTPEAFCKPVSSESSQNERREETQRKTVTMTRGTGNVINEGRGRGRKALTKSIANSMPVEILACSSQRKRPSLLVQEDALQGGTSYATAGL